MRYTQPQVGPYDLDKQNLLLRGTTGLWQLQNGFYVQDSITGIIGSIADPTNVAQMVRQGGKGLGSVSGTAGRYINTNRLASELGVSGASNRTIYGAASFSTSNDSAALFTLGVPSTGQDWTLRKNSAANDWRFNIWGVISIDFTFAITADATASFVCTQNGTTVEIWLNGVLCGSGTASVSTTDAVFKIGGDASFWASWTRPVYFVGVANRAWTIAEKVAFSTNPWQLFLDEDEEDEVLFRSSGGPTVWNVSVAETLVLSDASSVLASYAAVLAEFLTPVDATMGATSTTSATTEAITPTDSQAAGTLTSVVISETVPATDNPVAIGSYTAAQAEALTATETVGNVVSFASAIAEVMTPAETMAAIAAMQAGVTDTITVSEVMSSGASNFSVSISETPTVTDNQSVSVQFLTSIPEAIVIADASNFAVTLTAAIGENAVSIDVVSTALTKIAAAAEILNAAESTSINLVAVANTLEALSIADVVGASMITNQSTQETILVLDISAVFWQTTANWSDTIDAISIVAIDTSLIIKPRLYPLSGINQIFPLDGLASVFPLSR